MELTLEVLETAEVAYIDGVDVHGNEELDVP